MFLDPIDKDSKVESDDSWVATDLRAFGLHGVTLSLPGTRPHIFIMLPHLSTAEEGLAWCNSCCIPPTEEELKAAGPNLLQGGPSRVAFAKPSELHWSVVADKSFSTYCKKAHKRAEAEKKDGTSSTALEDGGGPPTPGTSGTGEPPDAPKSRIPDPFPDNPTPAQLRDTTAELLLKAQEMHVESLFKTGSIQLVDHLLTEALMTEFASLGMILSEDLVASLRAFWTEVKESCETLFQNLESALSHLPHEAVGQELYWIINEHSCSLRRDTSSLLATVNLVLADMKDFLDKCLEDTGSVGETKLIPKAFLDQFRNHFARIQKVVLHPAMHNSQVSNIVRASLAVLQPLTAFSFTSIVDQVIDRIGLTVPTKPNKDGDPGVPTRDRAGSHQIATVLDAQFKALLHELCEGTEDTRPHWYKPEALHLEYWKDFENRHPKYVTPVLPTSIFDQAEEEMRQLRELMPHTPTVGLVVMGANEFWQELCDTSPSQQKKKFELILEAQRHLNVKPQPDPPAPSAPPAVPKKGPKPNEPKGDGDPGDPEDKKEDKPQEPPSKPPGQPLK